MSMKYPPHLGRQIKTALDACNLTITEGVGHLGVSRNALSRVINGLAAISPDMAIRLSKAFGGTPDIWGRMQVSYDLAQAMEHEQEIEVSPLKKVA